MRWLWRRLRCKHLHVRQTSSDMLARTWRRWECVDCGKTFRDVPAHAWIVGRHREH